MSALTPLKKTPTSPLRKKGGPLNNYPVTAQTVDPLVDAVNAIRDGVYELTDLTLSGDLSVADDATITGDLVAGTITTAGAITSTLTTDSTTKDTGAIVTEGGIGVEKAVTIGTSLSVGTTSNLQGAVTFGAGNIYKALQSQTALAGGAQAGTALSAEYMNFTTVATALDSAQLPTPVLGTRRIVRNSATKPMAVFGQTGATIDDGSANAAIIIAPNTTVVFDAVSATAWKSSIGTTKVSDIITEQVTLTATEIVGTSAGDLGHASGAVLVAGVSSAYAMEFVSAVAIYDFDTAAYTGGGNDTTINIGSGGAALTGVVTSANLLGAAGDKIVVFNQLSTAALPLSVGTGLSMNSVTAWTQPGTAAGVLRVQISYRLHTTGL